MSHGSEDAIPDLADVVYQFAGMSNETVYQVRNNPNLTMRDLQNLRASARDVLGEIERAIEIATPAHIAKNQCTCPPVVWMIGADTPTHMLRCPQHRPTHTCTCYPGSGRMNLSPAHMHMPHCPWFKPEQPRVEITACGRWCQAPAGHCTSCGADPHGDVDSGGRCDMCRTQVQPAHSWCGTRP